MIEYYEMKAADAMDSPDKRLSIFPSDFNLAVHH